MSLEWKNVYEANIQWKGTPSLTQINSS
jgi:hypothetical protein